MSPTRKLLLLPTVAKLRTNHGSPAGRGRGKSNTGIRTALVLGILLALVLYLLVDQPGATERGSGFGESPSGRRDYLPTGPADQVIDHEYFSLGYDNDWELARWTAHHLTAEQVRAKGVRRADDFRPDEAVRDGSAERSDYRRSGYSRGHLVPFGDLNYDAEAGRETFLYSNMAPQLIEHNAAVWRELEDNIRDWAVDHGALYIITGPVVGLSPKRIGPNQVAVPEAFYKILLTERGEAIAFVIPHQRQEAPLHAFAKTVDEAEAMTGLDFFPELADLATPTAEANFDLGEWPVDERRFRRRIEQWNRQR